MSDITFARRHSLPIKKAKAQVQKAADALAAEHDLTSEWHGNTLRFQRTGVHGEINVTPSEVRLEVTLGFLLKPFKATLVSHIERDLDTYLPEAKATGGPKQPTGRATHKSR
jgi:putative polyhydroxyalkanoate system protein